MNTISEHNQVFSVMGFVSWGLWTKEFEDEDDIRDELSKIAFPQSFYFVDTTSKSKPQFYIADVESALSANEVIQTSVPEYYRDKIANVKFFFRLCSKLRAVDIDPKLGALVGVKTIYFLEKVDGKHAVLNLPRTYSFQCDDTKQNILILSDLHYGGDYGFKFSAVDAPRGKISGVRILPEVLKEDLLAQQLLGKISCVIILGDLISKGAWFAEHEVNGSHLTGLKLVHMELANLAKAIDVPHNRFFVIPGNHDVVREGLTPEQIREYLLDYRHELGFRQIREDFFRMYKLAPLNYGIELKFGSKVCKIGFLNSAYLNDKVAFKEYGYVGDDAEHVFEFLAKEDGENIFRVLAVHHHLLPVYELEAAGMEGAVSVTLDAPYLLRRAIESGVELVVHGHQHCTKWIKYSSWSHTMHASFRNSPASVDIFSCGSAGVASTRLPPSENNAYGILDVSSLKPKLRLRRIFQDNRKGEDW